MEGIFQNLKVLEFQAFPPLQFVGQMISDQGASVVVVKEYGSKKSDFGQSDILTRGKSFVQLNLKNDKEKKFLLNQVIPKVDVVLESYRPGAMEGIGLGPYHLHQINKNLIYVRLSGYGQKPTQYTLKAGHDQNYLALSGIMNKFRRYSQNSEPVPPTNILADFSSGSLFCFFQILQALIKRENNSIIDCSMTHNTLYMSQLELLQNVIVRRGWQLNNKNVLHFTRPHQTIYQDKNKQQFILKRLNNLIYDVAMKQQYAQDDHIESKQFQDLLQLVFEQMTVDEIQEKYGEIQLIKEFQSEVLSTSNQEINQNLLTQEQKSMKINNIFDEQYQIYDNNYGQTVQDKQNGWFQLIYNWNVDQLQINAILQDQQKKGPKL